MSHEAYLDAIHDTTALHSRRNIDRVSPNIILGLGRSNHAGHHGSNIDANTQLEVIEAVLVYWGEHLHHWECKVRECNQVMVGALAILQVLVLDGVRQASRCHVRTTDCLYFFHTAVFVLGQKLKKIKYKD